MSRHVVAYKKDAVQSRLLLRIMLFSLEIQPEYMLNLTILPVRQATRQSASDCKETSKLKLITIKQLYSQTWPSKALKGSGPVKRMRLTLNSNWIIFCHKADWKNSFLSRFKEPEWLIKNWHQWKKSYLNDLSHLFNFIACAFGIP